MMTKLWRRFLTSQNGNVMLTFGLAFPVIIGVTGLAIDTTWFNSQKSKMQVVADSTALALAKQLHVYRKNLDELKAIGSARAEALLREGGLGDKPHTTSIRINGSDNLIEVNVEAVPASFLPREMWGETMIRVSAQAHAFGQSKLCILGLDPAKADTVRADDRASISAPDCAVQSNSKDPKGIHVSPNSKITSAAICSSGGSEGGRNSFDPTPMEDCPPLDDPLSAIIAPSSGGCDFLDVEIKSGAKSISPGVYCGGLKIDGSASVTAEPGIYTFSDGDLEVTGKAKLVGEHVSFVFADDDSLLKFDKDTTIDLGAPKDGLMAGILMYESPELPKDREFIIKSEKAHRLLGTIYLPNGKLKIDAKGDVGKLSAYTVIVARKVEVKGANLVVNADYGGTDVPVPEGVGPNSSMVRLAK